MVSDIHQFPPLLIHVAEWVRFPQPYLLVCTRLAYPQCSDIVCKTGTAVSDMGNDHILRMDARVRAVTSVR